MAKHLSPKDLDLIVSLIDGWEGKFAWEALCDAIEPLIGTRPTRQTLNSHEKIKSAFTHHKGRLKSGFVSTKRPASLSIAEQRIRRLEAENNRLERENARLLERFMRWQYNAHKFNVSEDKLDAPLPFVDRDSSEGKS
ncbi:hypothetical protein EIG75_12595 [Pseudomonas syringae]|uniref:Uncharacterized protein n=1 Tax=Pseudomonas syringae TaxID=317 RepID=A0A6B2B0Q1_PSESX|nr:hypothetical protein [Pseudomonas syringae]MDC6491357.1 hypothetical protein [Pseudomonas syringae]MDC6501121.1 hypothetical protein [Pseudomonas syringae]MDC6511761.1 hypothetical protein [Pseudomonas syringae]MDC6532730.1 hypothetical protein [Pseudomonas syringae]MDC6554334.1 hypothetical protein [Pseudomonas syringae]